MTEPVTPRVALFRAIKNYGTMRARDATAALRMDSMHRPLAPKALDKIRKMIYELPKETDARTRLP